jgi:hypothetical protein
MRRTISSVSPREVEMKKTTWASLASACICVVLGACGSQGQPAGGAPADGGSGAEAGISNEGGPVFQDGGTVHNGPDAGPPDGSIEQTVTFTMDTVTVPAGTEVFKCQDFANPFGRDADVVVYDGQMSVGSHHFFLFTQANKPSAPVADCPQGGLEIHPFPYLSQSPHMVQTYPQGMGSFIGAGTGFMMQVHFLNATQSPIQASVKITLSVAAPGIVTTHVGTIFMNQATMFIPQTPPSMPVASARTCNLPQAVNVISSWSHMHARATDFKASANGQVFYESKIWSEPPVFQHATPLAFPSGTPITWECDYYNDTGGPLVFGPSAVANVMCIYVGQYYPAPTSNPDIQCILN